MLGFDLGLLGGTEVGCVGRVVVRRLGMEILSNMSKYPNLNKFIFKYTMNK